MVFLRALWVVGVLLLPTTLATDGSVVITRPGHDDHNTHHNGDQSRHYRINHINHNSPSNHVPNTGAGGHFAGRDALGNRVRLLRAQAVAASRLRRMYTGAEVKEIAKREGLEGEANRADQWAAVLAAQAKEKRGESRDANALAEKNMARAQDRKASGPASEKPLALHSGAVGAETKALSETMRGSELRHDARTDIRTSGVYSTAAKDDRAAAENAAENALVDKERSDMHAGISRGESRISRDQETASVQDANTAASHFDAARDAEGEANAAKKRSMDATVSTDRSARERDGQTALAGDDMATARTELRSAREAASKAATDNALADEETAEALREEKNAKKDVRAAAEARALESKRRNEAAAMERKATGLKEEELVLERKAADEALKEKAAVRRRDAEAAKEQKFAGMAAQDESQAKEAREKQKADIEASIAERKTEHVENAKYQNAQQEANHELARVSEEYDWEENYKLRKDNFEEGNKKVQKTFDASEQVAIGLEKSTDKVKVQEEQASDPITKAALLATWQAMYQVDKKARKDAMTIKAGQGEVQAYAAFFEGKMKRAQQKADKHLANAREYLAKKEAASKAYRTAQDTAREDEMKALNDAKDASRHETAAEEERLKERQEGEAKEDDDKRAKRISKVREEDEKLAHEAEVSANTALAAAAADKRASKDAEAAARADLNAATKAQGAAGDDLRRAQADRDRARSELATSQQLAQKAKVDEERAEREKRAADNLGGIEKQGEAREIRQESLRSREISRREREIASGRGDAERSGEKGDLAAVAGVEARAEEWQAGMDEGEGKDEEGKEGRERALERMEEGRARDFAREGDKFGKASVKEVEVEVEGQSNAQDAKMAFETTVEDDDNADTNQSAATQGWVEAGQAQTAAREAMEKAEEERRAIAKARMLRGAMHESDTRLALYRSRIAREKAKEDEARRKLDEANARARRHA